MAGEPDYADEKLHLEKELLAPYTHLIQIKGKQLRSKIALAFNHWLQVPEDKLTYIEETVKMLHIGTLLFDDIQDSSEVRRGIPAAHCVYGVPFTINAAVHVIFLVLTRILRLGIKSVQTICEDFLYALRGQGSDIYWRENLICPTEEEHRQMAKRKTGGIFLIAVHIFQHFSEYKIDLSYFALELGVYFQIRDDYCNLVQQEALEEWPGIDDKQARQDSYCEDLTEGKFSLPIIHAMNTPEGPQILSILRQRTRDVSMKKYCVSLLEKAGSLQYTRDVLRDLDRYARAEVARLGGNPDMEAVLDELLSWKEEK